MENNNQSKLINEIKKRYYKDWRDKNKDKVKSYNSKYWQKRAEQLKNNSSSK